MKKQIITISDELADKLQRIVQEQFHGKRGAISIIGEEALWLWIKERNKK